MMPEHDLDYWTTKYENAINDMRHASHNDLPPFRLSVDQLRLVSQAYDRGDSTEAAKIVNDALVDNDGERFW
jgi:hypothetical protein